MVFWSWWRSCSFFLCRQNNIVQVGPSSLVCFCIHTYKSILCSHIFYTIMMGLFLSVYFHTGEDISERIFGFSYKKRIQRLLRLYWTSKTSGIRRLMSPHGWPNSEAIFQPKIVKVCWPKLMTQWSKQVDK